VHRSRLAWPSLATAGLVLGLAACGSDSDSSSDPGGGGGGGASTLAVTLTDDGCDPTSLTADAGKVTFEVTSEATDRAEFEVLSATPEILAEEFLEPGKSGTYTLSLDDGAYQIICGAPSNTRADLAVGTGDSASASTVPVSAGLQQAVADYTAYVKEQAGALEKGTKEFTDAVRAGDTESAKALYATVRVPWEAIEPVAELFPDSDAVIDSRADDFPKAEADPDFTGFHALEYGLWAQGTNDGATVDLKALADRLDSDMQELLEKVATLTIQPTVMTNGAAALIEEASQGKITGEEERYSKTDLYTLQANVDGAKKIFVLVTPELQSANAQLVDDLTAQFGDVEGVIAKYKTAEGFQPYDKVAQADVDQLKTGMAQLSELLSQISGSLGLEVQEQTGS
jgi:iron uptake system component EfeO